MSRIIFELALKYNLRTSFLRFSSWEGNDICPAVRNQTDLVWTSLLNANEGHLYSIIQAFTVILLLYKIVSLLEDFVNMILSCFGEYHNLKFVFKWCCWMFSLFQTSCIYCSTEVQHELFPARLPPEYLLMREVGCRIPWVRLPSQRHCWRRNWARVPWFILFIDILGLLNCLIRHKCKMQADRPPDRYLTMIFHTAKMAHELSEYNSHVTKWAVTKYILLSSYF